jgi:hypothetical protein
LLDSFPCLATDLHIDSFPFPGYLAEIGRNLPIIHFISDDIDGAGPSVVLHLPEPIVHPVYGLFVGKIDEQQQQRRLFVHLVSDLQEVHPSAEVPEGDVDGGGLEGEELIGGLHP